MATMDGGEKERRGARLHSSRVAVAAAFGVFISFESKGKGSDKKAVWCGAAGRCRLKRRLYRGAICPSPAADFTCLHRHILLFFGFFFLKHVIILLLADCNLCS